MDFNLDFDLVTSDERRDFIASKDLSKLTQKEIRESKILSKIDL
jgi:hypothetical protein